MKHRTTSEDSIARSPSLSYIWAQLTPVLWQWRARIGLGFVLLLLAKLAMTSTPWALKQIVDHFALAEPVLWVPLAWLLAYVGLRFVSLALNELRDSLFARVTERSMRQLSLRMFSHLQELDLAFHLNRQSGGLQRDIERGTQATSTLLRFMTFSIIPTALELLLVAVILSWAFDWRYGLLTLVGVGLYVGFTLVVTQWRIQFIRRANAQESHVSGQAMDALLNYETVKFFNNEAYEANRYDQSLAEWERLRLHNRLSLMVLNVGQGFVIGLTMLAMLALAVQQVAQGTMSLGDLVLVNAYLLQLFIPLGFLGVVYRELRRALADLEQFFKLLARPSALADAEDAQPLQPGPGRIRVEGLSFAYGARKVLTDLTFCIEPGERVGIVGPSGAGKSTLFKLLFGFVRADAGEIYFDEQPLSRCTQASIRAAIGVVPQDAVLFNDTLGNNIGYGRPGASAEAIMKVVEQAQLGQLVADLPDGLQTLVGERGLKLSGGEKQRVALARVLLKDPELLIYDEATSALDTHAEQAILSVLQQTGAGKTSLMIAHRLSTLVDADRILVLNQGRLVEQGNHQSLLAQQGLYASLWQAQQPSSRDAQ